MYFRNSYLIRPTGTVALATLLAFAFHGEASAQNGTWTEATGDGAWSNTANWSGGIIADGAGNTADFSMIDADPTVVNTNFPGFYRNAINLDTSRTIGNLIFGDTNTGTPGGYEVYTGSGSILTLAGGTPTITVNPLGPYVAPTETIDDAVIRPIVAGTSGLTKMGAGILTLNSAATTSTLTGGLNINQGTLRLRSLINGQAINIANGATLDTSVALRNVAVGGAVHSINVASGATATIIGNADIGNVSAAGATLNLVVPGTGTSTFSLNDSWAVNGSITNLNVSSANGGFLRLRNNGGNFVGTSFQNTAVNLDRVTMWTRTSSGGNTINLGSLSGTSTAILSGGGQGGGTVATYSIGSLNTNTTFAGTIDTTSAPTPNTTTVPPVGGLNLLKVGTGTLTLSGTLSYQPTLNGTTNRRGGVTTVSAGTLALTNAAAIPGGVTDGANTQNSIVNVLTGATLDVSGSTIIGGYSTAPLQTIVGVGTIAGNYVHDEGILAAADTVAGATGTNPNPASLTPVGGTLMFQNNLTLSGTGTIKYDMTTNPAAGNDLIAVSGLTTLTSGSITPNFLTVAPSSGTYTVIASTGGFSGAASNITVNWPGRGADPVPFISGNNLQFTATNTNAGANLKWIGDQADPTIWDVQTTQNWLNGANHDTFFQLDSVTFDDSASSFTVVLNTAVQPTAVVVNNPVNNYSITGGGSIGGTATFTKQGAGSLILQTANVFTGPASMQAGTVDIGTFNGALGTGALTMSGGSTLIVANNVSGAITNTSLVIPTGQSATIVANGSTGAPQNNPITIASGGLSGGGNLLVTTQVSGRRVDLPSGNTGYTGTLTIAPDTIAGATSMLARLNGGGSSLTNASVVLNGTTLQDRATTPQTIALGGLTGDSNSRLHGFDGGSTASAKTWQIGALNTSTTFAGIIENSTGNTTAIATVSINKIGTGTLTLTGNNVYAGSTTIDGGTLLVNGTHVPDPTNIAAPNPTYTVNSGGTLGGTGTIGGSTTAPLTVAAGGTLSPGASIGTLSVVGDVTFADSTSIFKVEANGSSSTNDLLAITGNLTLNGASLTASLSAGTLPAGPFTIATYTGTLTGIFTAPSGISVNYGTGANSQITMTINSLSLSGDYNGDGKVDAADYVVWRKDPSGHGGNPAGYNTWRSNFGTVAGAGAAISNAGVPEPTAWILALTALIPVLIRRARSRSGFLA